MIKKEVIKVRISVETLVRVRAKTELSGEGISGYVRRLIMLDLAGHQGFSSVGVQFLDDNDVLYKGDGKVETCITMTDVEEVEKKSEPTVDERGYARREIYKNTKDAIDSALGVSTDEVPDWRKKLDKDIAKAKDLKGKKK